MFMFVYSNRQIQLLIPYQLNFGLYSSFVNYYVNSFVVADNIGIGYIGILSAVSTVTACMVALPSSWVANRINKATVMALGSFAFAGASTILICYNDKDVARWSVVVFSYALYGVGRSVWENTNKAVIADYYKHPVERDMAYAILYFSSGLSGALGYLCYQFLNRGSLVAINTAVPLFSLLCYLYGERKVKISNSHDIRINNFSAVLNECFDSGSPDDLMNPIRFPDLS
jgi:MFS family permease